MARKSSGALKAACAMTWAMLPEKLEALIDILEFHAEGLRLTREDIQARVGDGSRSAPVASSQGSVAVLPLFGIISQRMNMMSDVSGGTSTEKFAAELDALVANPQVSAIVLDVDSPGGAVSGVPELAAKIRAARDVKPIYAVANGMMASAAYWLASQGTKVFASPSAVVGSIGVLAIHEDDSEAAAKEGITRTIISAGKYKAEQFGALSDEAKAAAQDTVDQMYAMFVSDVAKGRGVKAAAVKSGYGEGRALLASDALAAGMIDEVATMDDVLRDLTSQQRPPGRIRADATSLNLAAAAPGGFSVPVDSLYGTLASLAPNATLVLSLPTAAPKAKEQTVTEIPTGAQAGAAPDANAMQAEFARREAIGQLCALVNASAADANAFILSGKTSDQVRAELSARVPAPTPIAGAANLTARVSGVVDRESTKPFAALGEQLMAIAEFGMGKGLDKRLMGVQAAASGASANVPSDGAFLIQKDFTVDLNKDMFGEGQVAADCDSTEVSANSDGLTVAYVDETSRATGSRWGGIQVYRGAEADAATAKKPSIGEWEARVFDLIGLAYMTERLLRDAPAMADVFQKGYRAETAFTVDDEVVRGTGAGQCLGVLNSLALVSVAKESGQVADTVVAENIIKMWARLLPRSKSRATWYINQEIEQQLQVMQIGTGASGQLVYMAPGGLSGSQFGTIYGRPVKIVEQCSAPGDVGDIILADLSGYKLVTKDGIQSEDSIHVKFTTNERTFRWITRVGGRPKLKSALTPYKGSSSSTLSDHVTLAAR